MRADTEEWIVALHESGHAIVAVCAGMDVREAVLHKAGSRQDEAGRCVLHDHAGERDADLARFLVYMFSGAAAEHRATGRTSPRDAADRVYARALATAVLEVEPESPRVDEMLQAAELIADSRMRDPVIWAWVQNVAKALVRRRRLTGRDIHELRPPETRR